MAEINNICDYADERKTYRNKSGWCEHKQVYCDGNGCPDDFFSEEVSLIEKKDVCKMGSIFGNYHIGITEEQIKQLSSGEVLGLVEEEYNIFLKKVEECQK